MRPALPQDPPRKISSPKPTWRRKGEHEYVTKSQRPHGPHHPATAGGSDNEDTSWTPLTRSLAVDSRTYPTSK
eukprot:6492547-Pyramimonas_sp.AAC.1